MRPAVGLSYVVGAMMVIPVVVIAVGAAPHGRRLEPRGRLELRRRRRSSSSATARAAFNQFALIMVWLYILGWSTYGPEAAATFAPEYKDTKNDTRKALAATGGMNVVLALLLPVAVVGTIGYDVIVGDLSGVVYLIDVMHAIVGDALGTMLTLCLCAGLLLSMNTATMDGSRALYALSEEGMTIKQLGVLNKHHVPARAMTRRHAAEHRRCSSPSRASSSSSRRATSGTCSRTCSRSPASCCLRRDRPNWPRPIKLGAVWMCAGGAVRRAEPAVHHLRRRRSSSTRATRSTRRTRSSPIRRRWVPRIIIVGVLALVAGVVGLRHRPVPARQEVPLDGPERRGTRHRRRSRAPA